MANDAPTTRCWLEPSELDGLDPDLVMAVAERLAAHSWGGGYDRNGSHAAGEYVSYTEGLSSVLPEHIAQVYATMLALHALKALREMEKLRDAR